jgi:hypothetical protein
VNLLWLSGNMTWSIGGSERDRDSSGGESVIFSKTRQNTTEPANASKQATRIFSRTRQNTTEPANASKQAIRIFSRTRQNTTEPANA